MNACRLAALLALAGVSTLSAQTRLLRFPDLHADRVVFTYGGDLWLAPREGGTANRLTSAPGVELFASFSPDGRWIAFTGQLDGDEQVFVVPADGGEPRQLTWYPANGPLPPRWGYDNQVQGWAPDGTAVLFRSLRDAWTLAAGRLYTVAMPSAQRQRGAVPVALPMPTAGAGAFSPDGQLLCYSPLFRDFRTWKRYQGGWAQDLFVFDPGTGKAVNITDHPRTDRDPMWVGDRIWFASDRSGTLNLWSYDRRNRTVHQETTSTQWDVRWPSAGGPGEHRVVYEKGGALFWFDCDSRQEHAIAIRVPDEGSLRRAATVDASGNVESFALSTGGRRAVFAARGEVLTVPKQHGDVRNLSRTPGAHEKHATFSPDGSTIAYVGDQSGEEQIWLVDHLGAEPPRQLTDGLAVMLYTPEWSPDGEWIAFGDKDGVVRVVAVESGAMTLVADDRVGQCRDYNWSPCSGWLAFSLTGDNDLSHVMLWSRADGVSRRVSRPLSNDTSPVFGPRGERLFFLGLRGFAPRLATTYEWDFSIDRAWGVYALALRDDLGPWLPQRSDEAVAADADKAEAPTFEAPIAIDLDGLAERVETVPVPLDNYAGLGVIDGGLCWFRRGGGYYGRDTDRPTELQFFAADKRETTTLASGVSGYAIAPDGKHVLVRSGREFAVHAAGSKDGKAIELQGLPVEKVPADEYWQIFHEVWRRYRDFFYVANMHGHDWEALRARYAPLVAWARHRSDLNYVLGEMIAELNVGHAYIGGGDDGAPSRPNAALPGLRLRFDEPSGLYRIDRILRGENDDAAYRSPATAVGVDLRRDEYVLAIDGEEITATTNPYALLRHKLGRRVALLVNDRPARDGARTVMFDGIASEAKLHYLAWVEANRARVAEASAGRIGYLHLPNMGADGIREFIKQYYPQRDKAALVIDDRWNGGGNVSQMVLNRLQRKLLMATFGRTSDYAPYPSAVFHGHLACLLNEGSASDGDIFPAMFRRAGLGPLIGKRSWGGIIGITNRGTLLDGGSVNVPEFGNTEPDGKWTIEGYGVDPDIVVENAVADVLRGRDAQLEKAVEMLLAAIEKEPRRRPTAPPPPVKTGR